MSYKKFIALLMLSSLFIVLNTYADEKASINVQNQTSNQITQIAQEGHNFNNIVGSINFVKGISPKQYREDLNILEKSLTKKYKKTIANLKVSLSSDKRQALVYARQTQEKELNVIKNRMANLQESYQQRVENLQLQINELNEFSYLYSPDVLRKAQVALANGDTSEASEIYTRITQLAKVVDKQAAKAEFNLGKIAEDNFDYQGAYQHYKSAAKRAEDNPSYLSKAGSLAETIAMYDKAIDYYEVALELLMKANSKKTSDVAALWGNLGVVWASKGQYDKAIGYYEKALASDLSTFGPQHPSVATHWNNLGSVWEIKGQYDKAIGYYEKALASDLSTYGPQHPSVATRWGNLGGSWAYKGQYDKAIGYYEKALASDLSTYGPQHPEVAIRWNNLGSAWDSKGQYDKAIGYYEKALASDLSTFGAQHPEVATRWNNLGLALYRKGQYRKAIGYYEKAISVLILSVGEAHPNTKACKKSLELAKQALKEKFNFNKRMF